MAKQVITTITDDLSGEAGAQPVEFSLQGVTYTIDLADKNLERLSKALEPFISKATKVKGAKPAVKATNGDRGYEIAHLREWAAKKKDAIPERGRIPRAIVEEYLASQR